MNEDLHDDEILMRYLDNEMSAEETAAFQQQLGQDPGLRQRLDDLQLAVHAVHYYGTAEKVRAVHKQMLGEMPVNKARLIPLGRVLRFGLGAAASVLVIFLLVKLYSSGTSAEKLFSQAYVEYDASALRSEATATSIEKAYNEKNYAEVKRIAATNAVLSQKDSLLAGLSFLKTNELAPSINWLSQIHQASPVRQDAEFYLALAYLKNKNIPEAVSLMKIIGSNPSHIYHQQFPSDYIARVEKLESQ